MAGWRRWREAMQEALYGDGGFYTAAGAPGRHFRTAAHVGPAWSDAVATLAARVDAALGAPDDFTVVDVGAGGGELLAALAERAPARWRLAGVDVAPRPAGLSDRVGWSGSPPEAFTGLLVAAELLDAVPVDVVERADDGALRVVEVALDGRERLGPTVDGDDACWLRRWWLPAEPGDRAEVGRARDACWRELVARVERGVAVAVDYSADPARHLAGTLTGYRDGRQVRPVPDRRTDLTAHVFTPSCLAAVRDVTVCAELSQRAALRALGVDGRRPPYTGDPRGYLARLAAAGAAAELLDPHGLGAFRWLVCRRDCPEVLAGAAD